MKLILVSCSAWSDDKTAVARHQHSISFIKFTFIYIVKYWFYLPLLCLYPQTRLWKLNWTRTTSQRENLLIKSDPITRSRPHPNLNMTWKRQIVCCPWCPLTTFHRRSFDCIPLMFTLMSKAHSWATMEWDVSRASSRASPVLCCDSDNI